MIVAHVDMEGGNGGNGGAGGDGGGGGGDGGDGGVWVMAVYTEAEHGSAESDEEAYAMQPAYKMYAPAPFCT